MLEVNALELALHFMKCAPLTHEKSITACRLISGHPKDRASGRRGERGQLAQDALGDGRKKVLVVGDPPREDYQDNFPAGGQLDIGRVVTNFSRPTGFRP